MIAAGWSIGGAVTERFSGGRSVYLALVQSADENAGDRAKLRIRYGDGPKGRIGGDGGWLHLKLKKN